MPLTTEPDGKDVVAGLKGDVNITADELYKNLSKTYGKSMLFMKFQAEVINSSIKTTDELKKTAEEYESNIKQSAESQAASSGTDAEALISQNIAQYGFTSDQPGKQNMKQTEKQIQQGYNP